MLDTGHFLSEEKTIDANWFEAIIVKSLLVR